MNVATLAKASPAETVEYGGPRMIMSANEALARRKELLAFVNANMKEGVHYDTLSGIQGKPAKIGRDGYPVQERMFLLQPGAQMLLQVYGFAYEFVDVGSVENWEDGFFFYKKKVILRLPAFGDTVVGNGIGSANSREDRYAGRWVFDNEVPKHFDRDKLKSRSGTSESGRRWTKYKLPNEDIYSLVNTIEKMACKRALVHAAVTATCASDIFSQDKEAIPPEAYGEASATRPWDIAVVSVVDVPETSPTPAPAKESKPADPPKEAKPVEPAKESKPAPGERPWLRVEPTDPPWLRDTKVKLATCSTVEHLETLWKDTNPREDHKKVLLPLFGMTKKSLLTPPAPLSRPADGGKK